jgi:hypothetical protein
VGRLGKIVFINIFWIIVNPKHPIGRLGNL